MRIGTTPFYSSHRLWHLVAVRLQALVLVTIGLAPSRRPAPELTSESPRGRRVSERACELAQGARQRSRKRCRRRRFSLAVRCNVPRCELNIDQSHVPRG